ncbi:TetR/AcrR family transcriptional regulator [Sesbania bispinosa]|nr:TetR/AcrR family transcriptional regulator [Sesbania bispinosa]
MWRAEIAPGMDPMELMSSWEEKNRSHGSCFLWTAQMASARGEIDRAAGRMPRVEEQMRSWEKRKCSCGLCFSRTAQMAFAQEDVDRTNGVAPWRKRVDQRPWRPRKKVEHACHVQITSSVLRPNPTIEMDQFELKVLMVR